MNTVKALYKKAFSAVDRGAELTLTCTKDWNGFTTGNQYALFTRNDGMLCARDDNEISTPIDEPEFATNFSLDGEIPEDTVKPRTPEHITLRALAAYLLECVEPFKVGDLLVWKNGLSNRTMPEYGQPVVVTEVLPAPIFDDNIDCSNGYYREPLNIKVAVLAQRNGKQSFVEYHVDSRRFRRYVPGVDADYITPEQTEQETAFPGGLGAVLARISGN